MFAELSLWPNLAIFAGCAVLVWFAGTHVADYADEIAQRTGIGHAVAGLLLLAGITSLPEVAVTVTASVGGNADLAVNNLLGSVAMQVAILAVADALIGKDALTSVIPDPTVLLQISLNVLVLSLISAAVLIGDWPLFGLGIGVWSIVLLIVYTASIWIIARSSGHKSWVVDPERRPRLRRRPQKLAEAEEDQQPMSRLFTKTAVAAAMILVAGFLLSKTGEAIAEQTGLGQSLGGYVLVAVSTSLPEVSTVFAAMKLRRYVMAVSDIFGTNLFNGGLLFVVDAVYRGGPVLGEMDTFTAFAAMLGVIVSTLFLVGLVERRDRTVLRMGYDSVAVLVVYLAGVAMLFTLR